MPDTSLAAGNLKIAKALLASAGRKPAQADPRRAISSAYYAAFHALAKCCADALVGTSKKHRPNKAWIEVYRGLEHGNTRTACERAANVNFSDEIKDFADAFGNLQAARERADYDPILRVSKKEAATFIQLAEGSLIAINSAQSVDKIAFAAWVLITSRGAMSSRKNPGKRGID